MIVILSANPHERTALAAVCASSGWPVAEGDSIRNLRTLLARVAPRVVVTRHQIRDAFSDDVLATVARRDLSAVTRVIVLLAAGSPPAIEARQISLGADCVLRDPVRTEVLAAYLQRYLADAPTTPRTRTARAGILPFAGGLLNLHDRTLEHDGRSVLLAPQVAELARLLVESAGEVVSYDTLFTEIAGRRFSGDTLNMRVVLGKLTSSAARVGIVLRDWVEVVPKAGYRYRAATKPETSLSATRSGEDT